MIHNSSDLAQRLAELKTAFDEAFASPPPEPGQDLFEFALILAGEHRYALRMHEIAGVAANRKIVPIPAEIPALLGLSAVQGQLVPVFALAVLLGGANRGTMPRWMALHRGEELVGLAFEYFEGTRHVPVQALHAAGSAEDQASLSRQTVETDVGLVPVLDVPSVVSRIPRSGKRVQEP